MIVYCNLELDSEKVSFEGLMQMGMEKKNSFVLFEIVMIVELGHVIWDSYLLCCVILNVTLLFWFWIEL